MTNLENADQQLQTNIENEAATRESADSALDSRTSALEAKTGSLNRVAAANSTSINESMTLKGKQYSATLQVNGSGAQIGVVNNSEAGLANDGGTAYTEYRARTGTILSKATNDISSTSSNGQVVDTAGDTTGEYSQAATAKSTGTTFTYSMMEEKLLPLPQLKVTAFPLEPFPQQRELLMERPKTGHLLLRLRLWART